MNLQYLKTLSPPEDLVPGAELPRVTALAWSPNGMRLAVATMTPDRYVYLFDDAGVQRDKFATKPAVKGGPRNYIVRALAFSPDSNKLAIAQSDDIVFIYKLGDNWKDKKTICNKFSQTVSVTSLCWPSGRPNDVVFGLADGKVRIGILRSNKSGNLYNTDSYCVSLALGPDGQSFLSGHLDGSVYRYTFPDQRSPVQALLVQVSFVPYALAWGEAVCVAGNSSKVEFYDLQGKKLQDIDYHGNNTVKEFSVAAFNPAGQTCVIGNYSKFFTYAIQGSGSKRKWQQSSVVEVENLLSVTALVWKPDGSRLVSGSLMGSVDQYDACMRRYLYRGTYEFTYTSMSSVVIKTLSSGDRVSVASRFGLEITKINIYSDRFLIANTSDSLLCADLETKATSEVEWRSSGKEKYYFENPGAVMAFNEGELSIIEYGKDEVTGSLRTEFMSAYLISLQIAPPFKEGEKPLRKIAYLLDAQTVRILDLHTNQECGTYTHDVKIDWLELNPSAEQLLFRDKARSLHLYDIAKTSRATMLTYCNYVNWVPDSDVVVAQSRSNMCIWYQVDTPEDKLVQEIQGDVIEIERSEGQTDVVVDEGFSKRRIPLDDRLISFGAAMAKRDYRKAVEILEFFENSPEKAAGSQNSADGMWQKLFELALGEMDLVIAQRAAAALGDMSKSFYLSMINDAMTKYGNNPNHWMVTSLVAVLMRQFKRTENIMLGAGKVDECIEMYKHVHKWQEALDIAQGKNHPSTQKLKEEFFEYLISTKQESTAGKLKEKDGDYNTALELYLEGGYPSKAADLVLSQNLTQDSNLTERVATALVKNKHFEKAGEFLESMRLSKRALEAYTRGNCFYRAVELARTEFPSQVVRLEEEWGNFLVSQRQMDAACNHFIQAGAYLKAINSAIEAKQWSKAVQILDQVDPSTAKPYFKQIAAYYSSIENYEQAERFFIQGGLPHEVVAMYTNAGIWDKAYNVAVTYMPEAEVRLLYTTEAQKMEAAGKFKEAERLYVTVKEEDMAISMYKKNRMYDDMIRLVGAHRKDLLNETHVHLALQFQQEQNFKLAEKHYIAAGEWKPAVSMYRENEMWEETLRVAKQYGGANAHKQVAYAFAINVGGDAGIKLLKQKGLAEQAVDYAMERLEFTQAFTIAEKACKEKIPQVHLTYAMALEDEGRFERAEEEFLKAKKPKEAIEMYVHQRDWEDAMRVAEQFDPASISMIQQKHGEAKAAEKDFAGAEQLILAAKKPEAVVKMYIEASLFDDATRVARKWVPRMQSQVNEARGSAKNRDPGARFEQQSGAPAEGGGALAKQGKQMENNKNYGGAIDTYLRVTASHAVSGFSMAKVERVWEQAVSVAQDYMPGRTEEVVGIVSKRYVNNGKVREAAELCASAEMYKMAVDILIQGKLYEEARNLANSNARNLVEYVNQSHQKALINSNDIGALAAVNSDAAIDTYMARGDWKRVYETASKQGEDVVNHYVTIHVKGLIKDGNVREALSVLKEQGAAVVPANFPIFKRLATDCLQVSPADESDATRATMLSNLRHVLYNVSKELKAIDPDSPNTVEFLKLYHVSHLASLRHSADSAGLKNIAAKCSVSLLRHSMHIPVDKAFFDAGSACKQVKWMSMAFVFYNRFVDLTDLIEEPDSGDIDNSDFLNTDIPSPFDVRLPPKHNFSEDVREETREWVLDLAMSNSVEQSLPQRQCEKCQKKTYQAALTCHNCKFKNEPCCVTGYPVMRVTKVHCKACKAPANKDDWNDYVVKMKCCPQCKNLQNPAY